MDIRNNNNVNGSYTSKSDNNKSKQLTYAFGQAVKQ